MKKIFSLGLRLNEGVCIFLLIIFMSISFSIVERLFSESLNSEEYIECSDNIRRDIKKIEYQYYLNNK